MTGKKKIAAERAKNDPRNVQVESLRQHENSYGDKFQKAKGHKYIHPRPAGDIAGGVVKLVEDEKPSKSKSPAAADAPQT